MTRNTEPKPICIDLNEFKIHANLKDQFRLTLHFDSHSRRFYLSIIALIINEMKKLGKITSIPLSHHLDLLRMLNETVGGGAGSSEARSLLPRIYRKWKDALPNLEDAPLFKVLGKKKGYDNGIGRSYPFTKTEKDNWANLFEYIGSEENVRLKFAVDKIGLSLEDVQIIYDDSTNGVAWDKFISSLKGKVETVPERETPESPLHVPESLSMPLPRGSGTIWQVHRRKIALVALIVIIAGAGTLAAWKLSSKPASFKDAISGGTAFPLPDRPSVAVLPFVNMSEDPKQEFFADGMTEEVITSLSKSPYLFVIARSSTSKYRNKPVDIRQVCNELGVRYVLEGSCRRTGEKIRITSQLIDSIDGHHLWAEHFDREIKEILTVQDEIALKITKALHVKLEPHRLGSETGRGAKNMEVFIKSMEAREQVLRYTKEGNLRARQLFKEVLADDPKYAKAYSGLAITYAADVWLGISKFPQESLRKAIEFGQKAVLLDKSDATAQATLAYLYAMSRKYDQAISQAERALNLDPNSYSVINNCGLALAYSGKYEEALPLLERAARLNPSVAQSFVMSSMAYRVVGRYDKAYGEAKRAVERNPKSQLAQIALAINSTLSGREREAHAAAAEVLKINPSFSVEQYGRALPFKDNDQIDLAMNALRKAGLK